MCAECRSTSRQPEPWPHRVVSAAVDGATARANPPTSYDVARLAGVSRATVSYVLNPVPHRTISSATVERVRAAAAQLGYVPHHMARSLRAGRSDLVLIPQPPLPPGPKLDALIQGIAHDLRQLGYTVVIHADETATGTTAPARGRRCGLPASSSRPLDFTAGGRPAAPSRHPRHPWLGLAAERAGAHAGR